MRKILAIAFIVIAGVQLPVTAQTSYQKKYTNSNQLMVQGTLND